VGLETYNMIHTVVHSQTFDKPDLSHCLSTTYGKDIMYYKALCLLVV